MTKTLVITSGKGGVGKTNIAVNAGIELAQKNKKVCLFDADLGMANVNILLGIHSEKTLDDYIFGQNRLSDIIITTKHGLDIIPGSSGTEKLANLTPERIADLTSDFSSFVGYDYFLIDTASGISRGVISFCLASTETIVVITSEATSLTDAYALLKVLSSNGYQGTAKILVNKCSSVPQSKETYQRFKSAVDKYLSINIAPAGMVVGDEKVAAAVSQQTPFLDLFPDSISSQCLRVMVSNLIKDEEHSQSDEDFSAFWQRYFSFCHTNLALPEDPSSNIPPSSEPPMPPLPLEEDVNENVLAEPATNVISFQGITDPLTLPTPIPLLARAFQLQTQAELSEEQLLDIFICDPVLLVKALQMVCSSATMGTPRITKIEQILSALGPETLSSLLLSASMKKALNESSPTSPLFVNKIWYHSYKCALIAQGLAEISHYSYPEEAYLSGLLHDIGRLALQSENPQVYAQSPHTFHHDPAHQKKETDTFAQDHAKIGAEALSSWNIHSFLVDAVEYHGEQQSRIETAFPLVKLVYLACRLTHVSSTEEDLATTVPAITLLDLSQQQVLECLKKAEEKAQPTIDFYQIPLFEEKRYMSPEKTQAQFRRQALDYSLLQGTLPTPSPTQNLQQILQNIHRSMNILFGINKLICLLPDMEKHELRAIGYPGCFAWDILGDISISLKSEESLLVKTYTSAKIHIGMDGEAEEIESLADKQIIRSLDVKGLVCIPMISKECINGIIIAGIQYTELATIIESQIRLEQFGAQSARYFAACVPSPPHTEFTQKGEKDSQRNLIQLQSNS